MNSKFTEHDNTITIPVLSKDQFYRLLVDATAKTFKEGTLRDIVEHFLNYGFPKLNWDNLGESLSQMTIYLPTVAVDTGDKNFMWVVNGNKAILINKSI